MDIGLLKLIGSSLGGASIPIIVILYLWLNHFNSFRKDINDKLDKMEKKIDDTLERFGSRVGEVEQRISKIEGRMNGE